MAKKSGRSPKRQASRKGKSGDRTRVSRPLAAETAFDRLAWPVTVAGSIEAAVRDRVAADREAVLSGQPLARWL